MQALIFAGLHRIGHLADHGYTVPVLERPHAPMVEECHAVPILQDMTQVWLEAGHGAQVSIDERNPARLSRHVQMRQQIFNCASFGQSHLQVRVTALIRLAPVTR
jgi:hypothetical protein